MRLKQLACTFLTVVIAAVSFAVPVSAASKPAAPAGVTATAKSSSTVRVEWKAVTGAAKYTVFYSADNKTYKAYGTVKTTYSTVKKLNAGTKYYFRVKALDASGNKSAYSKTTVATTPAGETKSSGTIKVTKSPGKVVNNDYAILKIKGKPNTQYTLAVYYSTQKSSAEGTGKKTSDASGVCEWKWKVGANTKPGDHKIVITGGGDTLETKFETVKK